LLASHWASTFNFIGCYALTAAQPVRRNTPISQHWASLVGSSEQVKKDGVRMKRFERTVSFYDLRMSASSRTFEAPASISTARALRLLKSLPEENRIKGYRKDEHIYYIKDLRFVGGNFEMLINKCDRQLADPRFSDPRNSTWRTAAREDGEGLDFSCHLIIRPSEDPLEPALAILENATGLSIMNVQRFLSGLLRDVEDINPGAFEFPHPDGSVDTKGVPKKYRARFTFTFDGHPSDELVKSLREGRINGIELITSSNKEGRLDTFGYVREVRKTLAISLGDQVERGKRVSTLRSFFQKKSGAYEKARISFVDSGGLPRTVNLNTADFSVDAESIFIKRILIDGFADPLEQAYESINPAIITKMRFLLG